MSIRESKSIAANEARRHFAELLEMVSSGEEVTITRRGTPVARLVPIARKHSAAERRQAIERIKQLGKGRTLGAKIGELIREGRR